MDSVIKRRRQARNDVKEIIRAQYDTLAICYSHASCFSENDEISPMITCIVVKSLKSNVYEHFGIQIEADLINCSKSDSKDYYPELELSMLEKFNSFMKRHSNCYWIHWNMVNVNYGFQAIKHRYVKLAGEKKGVDFYEIPNNKKIDLNKILENMYGEKYATHADRFLELLEFNYHTKDGYLNISQEEEEFNKFNYKPVAESIDLKVNYIDRFANRLITKKLNIPNKNTYAIFIDIITHPLFSLIGWIGTIIGLILAMR